MVTNVKQMDEKVQVKRYKVQHTIDEYTFSKDATIHDVKFDEKFIHVELTDQRVISIPLWWIPTIYNATMEDRRKFEINQGRTMIIWNPEKHPCIVPKEGGRIAREGRSVVLSDPQVRVGGGEGKSQPGFGKFT